MAEARTADPEILRRVTEPNNPRAGTEFLTGLHKKDVIPNLFRILQGGGPIQEKVATLGNVRRAFEEPRKSGLADNIIEKTPEDFINKVILEAAKSTSITPSAEAQGALETIRGNFRSAVESNRTQTLTGRSVEILMRNIPPQFLLEAVAGGIFNKKEDPEFRQVLFKTFLTLSANPRFQDNVLLRRGGGFGFEEPHEERRRERERAEERTERISTQEEQLRVENSRLNARVDSQNTTILRQQADIRELQKRLDETQRSSSTDIAFDAQIPTEWTKVLDVISVAVPERIISHIRARRRLFHPDTVLAPLEAAGIRRDSPIYKALQNFSTRWTVAINNAEAEAKKEGKIPDTNGGK